MFDRLYNTIIAIFVFLAAKRINIDCRYLLATNLALFKRILLLMRGYIDVKIDLKSS